MSTEIEAHMARNAEIDAELDARDAKEIEAHMARNAEIDAELHQKQYESLEQKYFKAIRHLESRQELIDTLQTKIAELEDQIYLRDRMEESYKATIASRLEERKHAEGKIERLGLENTDLKSKLAESKPKLEEEETQRCENCFEELQADEIGQFTSPICKICYESGE